jgi:ferredoxin
MTVRVSIDPGLCRGHQMCVLGSPDVFASGDNDDGLGEVLGAVQPQSRLEELRRVASGCPESAISIALV